MSGAVFMSGELLKDNPVLMDQYDYEKNAGVNLDTITSGSSKKIWWICSKGHSFSQPVIKRRDYSHTCPYCSGKRVLVGFNDLETVNPKLAAEWHPELNGGLTAQMVVEHSNKIVWWKCGVCGFEWNCKVNDRSNGRGCPSCYKANRSRSFRENYSLSIANENLAAKRPDLLDEWDYEKNAEYGPESYTTGSNYKAWWKCQICGNKWRATIKNRVCNDSGCPGCMRHSRTSFPEQALFYYVSKEYPNAINSYRDVFEDALPELDIYIPQLKTAIEYDGIAWHKDSRSARKAIEKYLTCKENGITLIRVSETKQGNYPDSDQFIYRERPTLRDLDCVIKETLSLLSCPDASVDTERDRKEIYSQYITVLKSKSIAENYPEAVKEWSVSDNKGLTPDMISATSNDKYWWICDLGHPYKMSPYSKLKMQLRCPYCSNKKVLPGFNDLATRFPQIAKEWDEEKNAPVKAAEIMPGSPRKCWWICKKGHSYQATPGNRTSGNTSCPYCSGKRALEGYNDLATLNPEVAELWDYSKNGQLRPEMVTSGSSRKVWWICKKGHSWEKTIHSQVNFNFCPVCEYRMPLKGVSDFVATHPKIAEEWNYGKNGDLTPHDLTYKNTKKVWWKCSVCGAEWKSGINTRVRGSGCPKCGYTMKMQTTRAAQVRLSRKDLVSLFPDIAKEWDYQKNADLDPTEISPGSNRKVWWICPKGHGYQAWMSDRTGKHKTGCPYCAGKRRLK